MCLAMRLFRSYATPEQLCQKQPVCLRPWMLNWEAQSGLRGYIDPARSPDKLKHHVSELEMVMATTLGAS